MKGYFKAGSFLCMALLALLMVSATTHAQSTSQNVTVTLNEFAITPGTITVTQGQTIHFTVNNTGKFPHNITFMNGAAMTNLMAQPLNGGQSGTADFTFTQAGTWEMHCPVDSHAAKGMVGQVIVVAAAGMPATGQGTDQTPLLVGGLLGIVFLTGGFVMLRRRSSHSI
ncbi:MAG: cupredoxin domain-containing protein [Chloroflexota bacterium]